MAHSLTEIDALNHETAYAYDLAGNLLSDGEAAYTYDQQNRLLTKSGANGTITYEYDAAGNLVKETSPDGTVSYTYNAQNKLVKGELSDGQSSIYTYNALGARVENVQVRANENAGYQNADLTDGSHGVDYLDFLKDGRAIWQRAWESEIGTTHQNDYETVTRHYVVDYLSAANRDLIATEDGSYVTRYVYDENSVRISAEFDYADGTQRGEAGENLQSDFAAEHGKVWYRWSLLGSTLFAVDASGEVVAHAIYDAWGAPLTDTYPDTNFSGLENLNNYTGYTWDETLGLYFAQNRFYAADLHRFTQEDPIKDGNNWYAYCGNNPVNLTDPTGTIAIVDDAILFYGGGVLLASFTMAEWNAYINTPAGKAFIVQVDKVVYNGVTYIGDKIGSFIDWTKNAVSAVEEAAANVANWVGNKIGEAWNAVTAYFEKDVCEGEKQSSENDGTATSYEEAKKTGKKAPKHKEQPKGTRKNPNEGNPNSSSDLKNGDGSVKQRRYYGSDGKPELDIDYNHSNSDGTHEFPHKHNWDWSKNNPRQPGVSFKGG